MAKLNITRAKVNYTSHIETENSFIQEKKNILLFQL